MPLLLLVTVHLAEAQRFQGGLLGGFNASQVEGDNFKGYNKPGILAGGFVQTDLAPAIFAGMENDAIYAHTLRRPRSTGPRHGGSGTAGFVAGGHA